MNRRDALAAIGVSAFGVAEARSALPDHAADQDRGGGPLSRIHLYLCAFHIAKKDPTLVFEAHHYCMAVDDEVHQCVIFDSIGERARILGVEYIISDKLYRALPIAEKKYYHPHAYEVTSGLLVAPEMKVADENQLMQGLATTWGKTWHTWPDPATALPMGEPLLMWAATRDGLIDERTLAVRDKALKISTPKIRKRRAFIGPVPQIAPPKSLDEVGRQWTSEGADVPKVTGGAN